MLRHRCHLPESAEDIKLIAPGSFNPEAVNDIRFHLRTKAIWSINRFMYKATISEVKPTAATALLFQACQFSVEQLLDRLPVLPAEENPARCVRVPMP